jgi:hypothetical protein
MQRIVAVVGLFAVGCGGEFAPSSSEDAGLEADTWTAPQCEAGAIECKGPVQTCGRRARTCNDDGTWSSWECRMGCPPLMCDAVDCSDPFVDCTQCPVRCTIGNAAGACH